MIPFFKFVNQISAGTDKYCSGTTSSDMPYLPEDSPSLLKKFLTQDLWNQLKDKKDKYGFTFHQLINSGVTLPKSSIGVYCGSDDSYKVFAPLVDKVIQDYHGHKPTDMHKTDWDSSKYDINDVDPEGKYVVSTRIRVARNLADFPLGSQVTKEQRLQVEEAAKKAFGSYSGSSLEGKYYGLGTMTKDEQKQLIEDHFLFKDGDKYLDAAYLTRDWPSGRGIFHNKEKTFLVWVNEEDQFRIISMQKGGNVKEVFDRLKIAQEGIEKVQKFARNDHLGYITSCPTNLGTGMRASVHVAVPNLAKDEKKFKDMAKSYHLDIRGIHGEHSESVGGVYDVSNQRRLGFSEAELVSDMCKGVRAMIDAEKKLSN